MRIRVYAGRGGGLFAFSTASCVEFERRSGDNGDAPGGDFNGDVDHAQPFFVTERRRFAGGAAGHQKIDAGLDLPRHQIAQRGSSSEPSWRKGVTSAVPQPRSSMIIRIARKGGRVKRECRFSRKAA